MLLYFTTFKTCNLIYQEIEFLTRLCPQKVLMKVTAAQDKLRTSYITASRLGFLPECT